MVIPSSPNLAAVANGLAVCQRTRHQRCYVLHVTLSIWICHMLNVRIMSLTIHSVHTQIRGSIIPSTISNNKKTWRCYGRIPSKWRCPGPLNGGGLAMQQVHALGLAGLAFGILASLWALFDMSVYLACMHSWQPVIKTNYIYIVEPFRFCMSSKFSSIHFLLLLSLISLQVPKVFHGPKNWPNKRPQRPPTSFAEPSLNATG